MTSSLDTTAPQYDVAESLVLFVDAAPADVLEAADRLAPGERVFTTRFADPAVEVVWDVRVEDDGEGSYLVSTRRYVAADEAACQAMLTRWSEVRAAAEATVRRTLRTIKRAAEDSSRVELALAA